MSTRCKRFGPRLTVSLTGEDYKRLQDLADKDKASVSWVVRRAIEDFLRRQPKPSGRAFRAGHTQKHERQTV